MHTSSSSGSGASAIAARATRVVAHPPWLFVRSHTARNHILTYGLGVSTLIGFVYLLVLRIPGVLWLSAQRRSVAVTLAMLLAMLLVCCAIVQA